MRSGAGAIVFLAAAADMVWGRKANASANMATSRTGRVSGLFLMKPPLERYLRDDAQPGRTRTRSTTQGPKFYDPLLHLLLLLDIRDLRAGKARNQGTTSCSGNPKRGAVGR